MKSWISWFLAVALLLGLTACGKEEAAAVPKEEARLSLTVTRNLPLNDRAEEVLAEHSWLEVKAEGLLVEDIPALLVYRDDGGEDKPIFIVPHEQGCTKEDALGFMAAGVGDMNAIFLSFDLSGHGESQRPFVSEEESLREGVSDLDMLLAYCSTLKNADMSRIVIEGIGIGADLAISYLEQGKYTPAAAVLTRAGKVIPKTDKTQLLVEDGDQDEAFFQSRTEFYRDVAMKKYTAQNQSQPVAVTVRSGSAQELPEPTAPVTVTTPPTQPPADDPDAVTLTVERNRPLTQKGQESFAFLTGMPVKPESILVDDIPAYLAYKQDGQKKPVYIYCHGSGGGKEEGLRYVSTVVEDLNGIFLSFDMGYGGESPRTGTVTGAEMICGAVADIDKLLTFCATIPEADLNRIYLEGMSGGAASALAYMSQGRFTPALLVVTVPCFDFSMYPEGGPPYVVIQDEKDHNPPLSNGEIQKMMEEYNPYTHADRMLETYIIAGVGLAGPPIEEPSSRKMEEKLREMGKTDMEFLYYPDVDHNFPEEYTDLVRDRMLKLKKDGVSVDNPVPKVNIIEK